MSCSEAERCDTPNTVTHTECDTCTHFQPLPPPEIKFSGDSLMALSIFLLYSLSGRRVSDSLRSLFFIPTALALTTSLFILFYISSTSNLFNPHPHRLHFLQNPNGVLYKIHNLESPIESQRNSSLDFDSQSLDLGVLEGLSRLNGMDLFNFLWVLLKFCYLFTWCLF